MGLKVSKKSLSDFSSEESLRCEYKFVTHLIDNPEEYYSYRTLFDFVPYEKIDVNTLNFINYAEIGNVNKSGVVEPIHLSFTNKQIEYLPLFTKIEKGDIIKPEIGDILISKIRPYLNKNILIEDDNLYTTKAFIHIRPKLNSLLFYIVLRQVFLKQINAVSRQGKGYPTIKEDDLKTIRFPKNVIDSIKNNEKQLYDRIVSKIQNIRILNKSLSSSQVIIDNEFTHLFGFDWSEFTNAVNHKNYLTKSSTFANNIDCRMGVRFHHKAGIHMQKFLENLTNTRIKNFIQEPIILGKSVSPSDYDESGKYYYISMANIKNWRFEPENCQKVSNHFANKNLNKTVQKNDILLARSGEGTIGKVALIQEDFDGIFADFTKRIRLSNYNHLFAYYYFRSSFFQYLIYTHKKGLGNNTNIFPVQVKELPIPDLPLKQQNEIANSIKSKIDKQKVLSNQIKQKQNEISEIVQQCIDNY